MKIKGILNKVKSQVTSASNQRPTDLRLGFYLPRLNDNPKSMVIIITAISISGIQLVVACKAKLGYPVVFDDTLTCIKI